KRRSPGLILFHGSLRQPLGSMKTRLPDQLIAFSLPIGHLGSAKPKWSVAKPPGEAASFRLNSVASGSRLAARESFSPEGICNRRTEVFESLKKESVNRAPAFGRLGRSFMGVKIVAWFSSGF